MRRSLALALLLLSTPLAHAQQSPWQGDWGAFTDAHNGQRLTISACTPNTCTFSLSVTNGSDHCDTTTKSTLTLASPTDATATLPGESATQSCNLQLHRDPTSNPAAITLTTTGAACTSYYCTAPAVTFAHTYPQSSTTPYTGSFSDECFTTQSPARRATCTDPNLATLETQWLDAYSDHPPVLVPQDASAYNLAKQADATYIQQCNTAPNPADCLHTHFTSDLTHINANNNAVIDAYTQRGDPALAAPLAQKIAGHYRHSFANGDVQGDTYRSTETLTITPVGRASIHFDVHLEFYNGHTCDLSGGALFRKDGSFVFDSASTDILPNTPACHLAITPTNKGINLTDLNDGGCKAISCGERGGYNGAAFLFTERIHPKPAAK